MLVDDQQPFSFDSTALDDFFNLDAINGTPSTSSSSPRSPFSFSTMPLTPPSTYAPQPNTTDDALFSLFLEDEFSKMPSLPPATSPYDFLTGITATAGTGAGSSPEGSSSSTSPSSHANSPHAMFAIDPQLVGTPATSKAMSDFDEDEEIGASPQQEDEDVDETPAPPVTKSKLSRKGVVMSGGVKKAPIADKENGAKEGKPKKDPLPLKILEPEDWRPSPEEYKKMSSKEKRQLRNKISARNFRVRRKEYISTLEGDIAERDRLIDAIRSELGSSRSENIALRQEIAALKKCLLEGRGLPDLPPPAELPPAPASPPPTPTPAAATTNTSSGSSVVTPNTQKDLPTSPRLSNRAFWGGLGGMGVTPVHATFVPPIAVLASKASTSPLLGGSPILNPSIFYEETVRSRVLQENLNPGLNSSSYKGLVEKKGSANINPALTNLTSTLGNGVGAFDTFADVNPFTFKTLDAYRMQLWGKMAAQQHAQHVQHSSHLVNSSYTSPTGLASNLKPHFFKDAPKIGPKGVGAAGGVGVGVGVGVGAGIGAGAGAYPTPPASPVLSASGTGPTREHVAVAALASQTLLSKLGSAFWEAFSGVPSSSSSSSGHPSSLSSSPSSSKQWDAEKVRKVLEGKAVVRVVDVDVGVGGGPTRVASPVHAVSGVTSASASVSSSAPASVSSSVSTLAQGSSSMSGSGLVQASSAPAAQGGKTTEKKCGKDCLGILEESMRSLTLNKK